MMKFYSSFRFRDAATPLHRLDPRAKFLVVLTFFLGALLFGQPLPLLMVIICMFLVVTAGRCLRMWVSTFREAAIFCVFIFTVNLAYGLFTLGLVTVGIFEFPAAMALRFLIFILAFAAFLISTSPDDFGLALQKSRVPFDVCFAFTMAMRFVPVLAGEAQSIIDAQKARGLELEKGKFLTRIKKYLSILIPLFVSSVKRSMELAEAMESRGYGMKKHRTSLYALMFRRVDYVVTGFSALAMVLLVYMRFTVPL